MKFVSKITQKEDIDTIISLYQNGLSATNIGFLFCCSQKPILNVLKQNNISRRSTKETSRKYSVNTDFFKTIDSHLKSQILGLIAADGCVYKNSLKIHLAETDKEYLETIKNKLNYTGELHFNKMVNRQNTYELAIRSDKIFNDLNKLGIVPCKSLTLSFPNTNQVQEKFLNSFVLGYFEGDGCVYINEKTKSASICICGTIEFCEKLKELIKKEINVNSAIYKRHKDRETNSWQLMFSGNLQTLRFLNWIYKDADFVMKRKHDKFLRIKSKYNL